MHANAAADEVAEANGLLAVDRRLAALCRERGPLRALLACIARRLVGSEAWERLGYARLLGWIYAWRKGDLGWTR